MTAAQILAVIIFAAMFLLIVSEKIERHLVSLGCGLLMMVLVFGRVCLRNQLVHDPVHCGNDADGGGNG